MHFLPIAMFYKKLWIPSDISREFSKQIHFYTQVRTWQHFSHSSNDTITSLHGMPFQDVIAVCIIKYCALFCCIPWLHFLWLLIPSGEGKVRRRDIWRLGCQGNSHRHSLPFAQHCIFLAYPAPYLPSSSLLCNCNFFFYQMLKRFRLHQNEFLYIQYLKMETVFPLLKIF